MPRQPRSPLRRDRRAAASQGPAVRSLTALRCSRALAVPAFERRSQCNRAERLVGTRNRWLRRALDSDVGATRHDEDVAAVSTRSYAIARVAVDCRMAFPSMTA